jgi:type III secretory pathway component EscV
MMGTDEDTKPDGPTKADKMEKIKLDELRDLERLEDTGKVLLQANEALVIHELRRVLERQAERDLVIDEMRSIIDTLAVGHVMAIEEIKKLKNAQNVLLRQQVELHERQDMISAVCDAFAAKLEQETQDRLRLAEHVGDRD